MLCAVMLATLLADMAHQSDDAAAGATVHQSVYVSQTGDSENLINWASQHRALQCSHYAAMRRSADQ